MGIVFSLLAPFDHGCADAHVTAPQISDYLQFVLVLVFIHPSSSTYPGQWSRQSWPDILLTGLFLQLFQGNPKVWGVLGASGGHPEQMPEPPQLSILRSRGSTLSSSWVTDLLTLCLRKRPATLRRKLISTTCILDLVFDPKPMTLGE